jgi:hypothetical protein
VGFFFFFHNEHLVAIRFSLLIISSMYDPLIGSIL